MEWEVTEAGAQDLVADEEGWAEELEPEEDSDEEGEGGGGGAARRRPERVCVLGGERSWRSDQLQECAWGKHGRRTAATTGCLSCYPVGLSAVQGFFFF